MATELTLRDNEDIQGDILAGFKKDQMVLLFLSFDDPARARTWLQKLTPRIATTRQVATFNKAFSEARKRSGGEPTGLKATWLNVSFTFSGLEQLAGKPPYPKADEKTTIGAFQQGASARAGDLNDTGDSAPDRWVFGNHKAADKVHAVLTVAADTVEDLQAAVIEQREAAAQFRVSVLFQQNAATLPGTRRGKEHFGFKDGVSEPGVLGFDEADPLMPEWVKDHPGTRLIPPGEFVVGHPAVTPPANPRPEPPAWAVNGTFHVVRRLAQDVPGWWAQIARQLPVLKDRKLIPQDATAEWLAARVVGRWRSGTPVHKCPHADQPFNTVAANDNDISYRDDLQGVITPLFSHLRKTNPRDGLQTRVVSIADGSDHVDVKERDDGPLGRWKSLTGVRKLDVVLPVPDMQRANGKSWFWVFHTVEGKQRYRVVSIADGTRHEDVQENSDRLIADWDCLRNIDKITTILPIPDMQRVKGVSLYWVFHRDMYRIVEIADGPEHLDRIVVGDRPVTLWKSLTQAG